MDSLYISHTGMTEPLGRSQVLPYVLGMARRGFSIDILSHEPAGTSHEDLERARSLIESAGVGWFPQVRSPSHHLATKTWESGRAALLGLARALRRRPKIIHARSYLPAAVADVIATLTPGARMLFDIRGMLGDEYVDAGHWTEARLEYKLVKRFEARALRRADGIVVLTEALRGWIRDRSLVPPRTPIAVIPCCVETDRFTATEAARREARERLGVGERLVLLYSGTLGSWYLEREMARFAAAVRRRRPDVSWVVLTRADPTGLLAAARDEGIEDILVRAASPAEMPRLLPGGDIGMSFIRPCFSKMGSSPTKVAEYLAAGLTVVVNPGVGDQGDLSKEEDACVVTPSFGDADVEHAAERAVALAARPIHDRVTAARSVAARRFDLVDVGLARYEALYRALAAGSSNTLAADELLGVRGSGPAPRAHG